MRGVHGRVRLVAVLAMLVLGASTVRAAGEKYIVFGADTTPAERGELAQLLGLDASSQPNIVTTQEVVAALRGTGLPVAATEKSISSSALTCLNQGEGLTVRTANITRIPAAVYANALVTAGVGDANVQIAAPSANPVTGEAALVGVLKAFPQCQAGRQPEQARVALAYEQVARIVNLAGPSGDLTRASATILKAARPVILGEARDDTRVGVALDQAAASEGVAITPAQRGELVPFLQRLGGLDYGTYARGYDIQQVSADQVRVTPRGADSPVPQAAQPPATAASGGAPAPVGARFTGEVARAGNDLTVDTGSGQTRTVAPGPNVQITRDGKGASLGDLRPNDKVTVITNPDGTAQRIDAASASDGLSVWTWLAPLLGLLLLGLLLWLLMGRRKRDDFILEPDRREPVGGSASDRRH